MKPRVLFLQRAVNSLDEHGVHLVKLTLVCVS